MIASIVACAGDDGPIALHKDGYVALEQLLRNATKLDHLDLDDVGIGNEGLEMLAVGIVHNSSLTECFLSNRSMRALNLYHNNIGDEGLMVLASPLVHSRALRVLTLSDNNIGDEGLVVVAKSLCPQSKTARIASL
jgi:Ran GTPase-activating protein (RanGAP) involved in mRNA processing and transport